MNKFPKIKIRRGDIALIDQKSLDAGQLFWSYINTEKNHTYSDGQLWIKDPSDKEHLTEIANRRSVNALVFRGPLFSIDEKTFENAHIGDFYSFEYNDYVSFEDTFIKGDLLLITEKTEEGIKYQKIPGGRIDESKTDLSASLESDAVLELEERLRYRGVINNSSDFFNATKKKGDFYILASSFYIKKKLIDCFNERKEDDDGLIPLYNGDFIWWNGSQWELIPVQTGFYSPNKDEIEKVSTFDEIHKEKLKAPSTVSEALNLLNITKAAIGEDGKILYSQLPEEAVSTFTLRGKFFPVKNFDFYQEERGQNEWPTDEKLKSGFTWIVDCSGFKNVSYIDKTNPERVIELNTGDFIIWVEESNRFEVLDNSDHVSGIQIKDIDGDWKDASGLIKLQSDNEAIRLYLGAGNVIHLDARTIALENGVLGVEDFLPIFRSGTELGVSKLHQVNEEELTISDFNFQVGKITDSKDSITFGNSGVSFSVGGSLTTYINNYSFIDSAHLLKSGEKLFFRSSRIHASPENDFALSDEILDIILPQISGTLIARDKKDKLSPGYLTKNHFDGIVTDSLTAEEEPLFGSKIDDTETFEKNQEDGFLNVGLGRITTEDTDTGEITFYAKTSDYLEYKSVKEDILGFYTQYHGIVNNSSINSTKKEHLLNRSKVRTHLVINPDVLVNQIETFVNMPYGSGTLMVWEEFCELFGNGVPLMIPAWEIKTFPHKTIIGFDTSPITIKLNRKAHDKTLINRTNDLSQNYGKGKNSTFSYIGSNQVGSVIDKERGSIDDVVTFDAWLESQRAIATKEAFVLPASTMKDDESETDPLTGEVKEVELKEKDNTLKNGEGGEYSRILPSRTLYPYESVFYDPITGKLLSQELSRDVEMPAEGGVLLTSRSRIDGGVYLEDNSVID